MSDPTNLADCFQNLGLQEDRLEYHELTIDYPVLDLILPEEDTSPCLRPPKNIKSRERPDASKYHQSLTGTDFKIRIPLEPTLSSPVSDLAWVSIAIQKLLSTPGRSLLQIASYSTPSDGDSHIFRLVAENPITGQYETVAESDISSLEWEAERTALEAENWTRLADSLINRSSDRAYFHVNEKLRFYSWYRKLVQGERWGWAGNGAGGSGLLTCGHAQAISLRALGSPLPISDKELCNPACDLCGAGVTLSEEGLQCRRLFREAKPRVEFTAREGFWKRLEELSSSSSSSSTSQPQPQALNVNSRFLLEALKHAIPSIRVPETVCPRALQWVTSREVPITMLKVLERVEQLDDGVFSPASAQNLENSLLGLFEECMLEVQASRGRQATGVESLPEEFISLLRLWVSRTVRLVLIPGYDGRDLAAVFGEGGDMVIGDGVGEVMDELETMLRGARLD